MVVNDTHAHDVMLQRPRRRVRSCGAACFDCWCTEKGRGCTGVGARWENSVSTGQLCGDTNRSGEVGLLVSSEYQTVYRSVAL